MTPEGKVRKRLKDGVEALGGMVEPLRIAERRGPPDVLITLPPPIGMRLVETKCEDGVLESWQARDHKRRLRIGGVVVHLAWNVEEVDKLLARWAARIAMHRQSRWPSG